MARLKDEVLLHESGQWMHVFFEKKDTPNLSSIPQHVLLTKEGVLTSRIRVSTQSFISTVAHDGLSFASTAATLIK